jgi:regulatory protein spx
LKRAQMFYLNPSSGADETRNFLEENGVVVVERDLTRKPLTRKELSTILGYLDPRHYLNPLSPAYTKRKLDKRIPPRPELLDLIVEHPDLLRDPIIMSGRLLTIGNNRKQLIEMFQITVSGNGSGGDKGEVKNRH